MYYPSTNASDCVGAPFVRLISLSQTGSMLPFVFTRSDCHMTIITLIHWTMYRYK